MNTKKGYSLIGFLLLLLVAFVAGCGNNDNAAPNSAKAITAYSLAGVSGTIDGTAKTIAVALPNGTSVTALIATFTSSGSSIKVGTTLQTSGTTTNNFTSAKVYTVTAADGTTATYTVTVTLGLSSVKAITAYSLANVTGTINKTSKTITVTLPYSTPTLTGLIATYTRTGPGVVTVGTTMQTSGTTANNFNSAVIYTVTAADGTSVNYTVTVAKALITDKTITAFSLNGVVGTIDQGPTPKTISVTMPYGSMVTSLTANFSTSGTVVTVGSTTQVSGTTTNNFTSPVTYTVTAADASTAAYAVTVSVTVALGPAPVDLGTAGNFVILAKTGVSVTGTTSVTGDIGLSPAAATYLTGFSLTADPSNVFSTSSLVTGQVFAANYADPTPANLTTAVSDMETAYTDAAGRSLPDYTELYAGDISGRTLVPGLYKWGTGVLLTDVGVTLSGGANDVWIFQIAENLTVSNSAMVTLIGGAQAKNIFWQVACQTTLGTAADFKGIILCQTLISMNTGAVLNGRALAQTAVTLNANAITQSN
jgi:hypothetical protein